MKWNKYDNWSIKHGYWTNINKNKLTKWTREARSTPEWWVSLLHGKQRLVNKYRIIACMYKSGINQSCITINPSTNQWGNHICWAPAKARFILHELVSQISLFRNYEKIHSCLCKIKRNRRLFENWSGIKTVREKTGFLKFIWKLESRKLFQNWSLGN